MDRLEALGSQLSQITMYDIKSMYNQAKNVVLNVSEMEAKVQEATNDDPWGASSTLMTDIAQGTFSFQHFNEIMPAIYSRFMDKEARQWRQIYKALQLLEYLIKHGSERVVDDARSHVSTLKMLRSFHYIDDKGKDEGINVRNRAKELVELLSDVEKIRTERRKAKQNKHKYIGTGNDGGYGGGMSFSSGGSRYGGFGSESLGGGGGSGSNYDREYGSSYSGGGSSSGGGGGFRDTSARGGFEEYDAGGDEMSAPRRSNSITTSRASGASSSRAPVAKVQPPPPKPAPEIDLLGGFDEPETVAAPAFSTNPNKALPTVSQPAAQVSLDDDDFADFQAAPTTPTASQTAAPANAHARGVSKPTLMDMLSSNAPAQRTNVTSAQQSVFGAGIRSPPTQQNYFGGMSSTTSVMSPASPPPYQQQPQRSNTMSPMMSPMMSPSITSTSTAAPTAKPAAPKGGGFDDLWSMSLGSAGASKPSNTGAGKSIKDLEKEKAQSGLWGAGGGPKAGQQQPFGSFGNAAPSGAGDDLLL